MHFKDNILKYTLIPLCILFVGASYVRFMVVHDFVVSYEGICDESTESCFIGCEDEECTSLYYYTKIEKYAADVFSQCGEDITDCEYAFTCLASDRHDCKIEYCTPEAGEECSTPPASESGTDINI